MSVPQAPPCPVTPCSQELTRPQSSPPGTGQARYTRQACTRCPLLSDKIRPLHHMPAGPQSLLPTVSSSMDTGRRCSICGLISPRPAVAQAAATPSQSLAYLTSWVLPWPSHHHINQHSFRSCSSGHLGCGPLQFWLPCRFWLAKFGGLSSPRGR